MPRKNAHAVALGRLGGSRATAAQRLATAANVRHSKGRPSVYRIVGDELHRRDGDHWIVLTPPYDAATVAFLRRQIRKSFSAHVQDIVD